MASHNFILTADMHFDTADFGARSGDLCIWKDPGQLVIYRGGALVANFPFSRASMAAMKSSTIFHVDENTVAAKLNKGAAKPAPVVVPVVPPVEPPKADTPAETTPAPTLEAGIEAAEAAANSNPEEVASADEALAASDTVEEADAQVAADLEQAAPADATPAKAEKKAEPKVATKPAKKK
jgi:hypothetical protein